MKYFYVLCFFMFFSSALFAGLQESMEISKQGVLVQQEKIKVIAENVANVNNPKKKGGKLYQRKDIKVIQSKIGGVKVDKIYQENKPSITVYDPAHPDADDRGFVHYPDISVAKEMADLAYSQKVYEANTTVYNTAKSMAQTMINIGK